MFAGFSVWVLKEPLGWNHATGFGLIALGAWFIFQGKSQPGRHKAAGEALMASPADIRLLRDLFFDFPGDVLNDFAAGLDVFADAFDSVAGRERRDQSGGEKNGCKFFHVSVSCWVDKADIGPARETGQEIAIGITSPLLPKCLSVCRGAGAVFNRPDSLLRRAV